MAFSYTSRFAVTYAVLSLAWSMPSIAESPKWNGTTRAPCVEDSATGAGCSISMRKCSKVKEEIIADISKKIATKIEYYYKGIDLDFTKSTDSSPPQGGHFNKPVCNPADGETSSNHLGESCGTSVKITDRGTGVFDDTHGSKELAYLGGAWVAALNCYLAQITQEIRQGTIKVSPGCQELGKDVSALFDNARKSSTTFLGSLGARVENFCQQKEITDFATSSVPDLCKAEAVATRSQEVAKHRISACLLASARASIEAAFKELAICELFGRADASFLRHFTSENAEYRRRIKSEALQPCADETKSVCPMPCAFKLAPISCAKECAAGHVSSCYESRLPSITASSIREYFPRSGTCRD